MSPPDRRAALEDLSGFLQQGVSLVLATCDAQRVPDITRCGAARIDEGGRVLVAIAMPEGSRALTNLESNRTVSLTAALPSTYRAIQLKGFDAQRVEWPAHAAATRAHREAFVDQVVGVGVPREFAAHFWSSRFVTIAFTPSEIYEQTPGPNAGAEVMR